MVNKNSTHNPTKEILRSQKGNGIFVVRDPSSYLLPLNDLWESDEHLLCWILSIVLYVHMLLLAQQVLMCNMYGLFHFVVRTPTWRDALMDGIPVISVCLTLTPYCWEWNKLGNGKNHLKKHAYLCTFLGLFKLVSIASRLLFWIHSSWKIPFDTVEPPSQRVNSTLCLR